MSCGTNKRDINSVISGGDNIPLSYGNECDKQCDKKKPKAGVLAALVFGGIFTGFLSGLFGGGGGMIVVPLLTFVMKLEEKKAHATAVAVILPLSAAAAFFYLFKGAASIPLTLRVGAGVLIGGIAGAVALKKTANKKLRIFFYAVMAAGGLFMIFF